MSSGLGGSGGSKSSGSSSAKAAAKPKGAAGRKAGPVPVKFQIEAFMLDRHRKRVKTSHDLIARSQVEYEVGAGGHAHAHGVC